MNVSPTRQKMDAGTCPHGNPIGACPICAGLTGGGGGLANNKARKAGEWTYDQCYAVWQQMLKSKREAQEQKIQQKLDYVKAQDKIKSFAEKLIDKISSMNIKQIQMNNQNETLVSKVNTVFSATVSIALNIVNTTINIVRNTFDFISMKFVDISDKLSAVYGELKLKIEKFLSERTDIRKKLRSLFEIFVPLNVENESKKIDEEKILYRLRTTLSFIKDKLKKRKEVIHDNSD